MKRSLKISLAVATATALAALAIPAAAEDIPGGLPVSDESPTLLHNGADFGATGVVEPEGNGDAGSFDVPGLGPLGPNGLGGQTPGELTPGSVAAAQFAANQQAIAEAANRVAEAFPDGEVAVGEAEDRMFANRKYPNGSKVTSSSGPSTSTSNADASYTVTTNAEGLAPGSIKADYGAKATVRGSGAETTVNGNVIFEDLGQGIGAVTGNMGFRSSFSLLEEGEVLELNGFATVHGGSGFTLALGSTSYAVGLTARTGNGPQQVGANVAVSANGEVQGVTIGGTFQVPGVSFPMQFTVSTTPSGGAGGSVTPVPGVSVSGSTNGTFSVDVDIPVFADFFGGVVSGK